MAVHWKIGKTGKKFLHSCFRNAVHSHIGKERLSDKKLVLFETANAQGLLRESPEIGMINIKTDKKDLNYCQVYIIYKQQQAIEQAFKIKGCTKNQEVSCIRNNYSE